MKTWSRRNIIASAPPTSVWPTVLDTEISKDELEKFKNRVAAVEFYFGDRTLAQIQIATGVHRKDIQRLVKKCLLTADDGKIFGFRALIPFIRMKEYSRTAKIEFKFPEQKGGQSGALAALFLRFPSIEDEILKLILQERQKGSIPEFKLRPRDLHRFFITLLKKEGVTDNEWPFNTKFRGIRSIEKYMKRAVDENFSRSAVNRGVPEALAHLRTGTGKTPFLTFDEPFDAVEIDAYKIESHMTVEFITPEGTVIDLVLERLWLIAALESCSTAVLAYNVVYSSEVCANDVLKVIRDASIGEWKPKVITIPGISYPKGGGLPSGVLTNAKGIAWTCTLFDGALVHLSKAMHEQARRVLGFAINWGAVGHFERRPNVERLFNQIAKDIFKRLPSTTGSHPHNGRAVQAEEKAIKYKIRANEVEQLLDIQLSQHNITPSEGISFLTPMDFLRFYLDGNANFMARSVPLIQKNDLLSFASREVVTVRGNLKNGRRPYIQLDRVHYTSHLLAESGHLIGQKLILEVDEEDMRQVRAFLPNGAEIGFLKATGKWSLTKHSRRTRRAINRLMYKRIITISEFDDPIQVYLRYLADQIKNRTHNVKEKISGTVTELTRVKLEKSEVDILVQPKPPIIADEVQQVYPEIIDSMMDKKIVFFSKVKNRR